MADDAEGGERSGVSVEAHFLGRHAHDADDGFIDLVLEHDLVVGSGLRVLLAEMDEAGGRACRPCSICTWGPDRLTKLLWRFSLLSSVHHLTKPVLTVRARP